MAIWPQWRATDHDRDPGGQWAADLSERQMRPADPYAYRPFWATRVAQADNGGSRWTDWPE
jgi:hypothetical protein